MTEKIDVDWQKSFAASWSDRNAQGRSPHAVLLIGPRGVGKRAAAAWMAATRLGLTTAGAMPQFPFEPPQHADLRWISPPEDKQGVLIDQIRQLVVDLALTSYEGKGKVAVIEPANSMTNNAANSLLKTLEEPPGDTLLILVADRVGRLPATIFSRCQRIDFPPPSEAAALAWLKQFQPGTHWAETLRMAGYAPLAALAAAGQLDTNAAMSRDFNDVAAGRASPVEVAAKWARIETAFVFDWLARQLRLAVLSLAGGRDRAAGVAIDESVLKRMDRRNLFCYLDTINRLRGQPGGSFNVQLTLEGLLIDWAEGLASIDRDSLLDGLQLMHAQR